MGLNFLTLFLLINTRPDIFFNHKQKLIKETAGSKLENYLQKIKMKNNDILNTNTKDSFIFIDTDADNMIIKQLTEDDLTFGKMQNENNFDEFKARVFAYLYKNKTSKTAKYVPIGVNKDEEKVKGWRVYLTLMNSLAGDKHKLIKVCFPEDDPKGNFALVLNKFDESCQGIVQKIEEKKVLALINTSNTDINSNFNSNGNLSETTEKLRKMQSQILDSTIRNRLKNTLTPTPAANSFLEKSSTTSTKKSFSMEALAEKFSLEELSKIKALIKFGKDNKIIDEIYKNKGNLKLNELVNIINNNNDTLIDSSDSSNNDNNTTLQSEVRQLKQIIRTQNDKIDSYYKEMNQTISGMNDMLFFVKELSGEFQKTMLAFGDSLKKVNGGVGVSMPRPSEFRFKEVVRKDDNKQKEKEIKKLITKAADIKKPLGKATATVSKVSKPSSPFLNIENFDSMEDDDDMLEIDSSSSGRGKTKNKLNKNLSKKKGSISVIPDPYDDENEFINP
jgi:hypothetical protein